MPVDILTVENVVEVHGASFWDVEGYNAKHEFLRLTTNIAGKASLCQRGKEKGLRVIVSWREMRRFGKDIVSVELEQPGDHAS